MTISRPSRQPWRLGVLATVVATTMAFGTPANAEPAEGQILHSGGATAVSGSYIVVFKDAKVTRARVNDSARALAAKHGGTVARTYRDALRGFEARYAASRRD